MSFFDSLIAGGLAGYGKGMVDEADYNDKLEAAQASRLQQQQFQQQMQQQRLDEAAARQQDRLDARAATSGRGGTGGGQDVVSMIMGAKTPEDRQQALGMVEALGGRDAAMQIADKVYGKPMQQEVPADYVGLPGQSDIGPDAKRYEKAAYIAEKGAQELQRLFALTSNKGEIKNFAEGEQIMGRTDLAEKEVSGMLKAGKPISQATDRFNEVTNSAKVNPLGQQYAENKSRQLDIQERTATSKSEADAAKAAAQEAKELDRQILEYEKLKKDARPKEREAYEGALIELRARRKTMDAAPTPKPATSNWSAGTSSKPAGTSVRDMIKAKGY